MKKVSKVIGKIGLAALVAGLVPYRFKSDAETGAFEVGGLLWSLKKTPGDGQDNYEIYLFSRPGSSKEAAEEVVEAVAEETEAPAEESAEEAPTEEPAAEITVEAAVEEQPEAEA